MADKHEKVVTETVRKCRKADKKPKGKLFIVSGPAGAGKGEVTRSLVKEDPAFCLSISMTSRPRLGKEVDGVDYYYVTREQFEDAIAHDGVLEYTEYCGNYYGTPKAKAMEILESGRNLLLEIEVDGAMQVKKKFPDAILVMIIPPDVSVQEKRLRSRGRDSDESIARRLLRAREELKLAENYDYVLINYDNRLAEVRESIERIAKGEGDIPDAHDAVANYFAAADAPSL